LVPIWFTTWRQIYPSLPTPYKQRATSSSRCQVSQAALWQETYFTYLQNRSNREWPLPKCIGYFVTRQNSTLAMKFSYAKQ
jgi:hypothetical protein